MTFQIGVPHAAIDAHRRLELEDRLLDEARSLMRRAARDADFDWSAHGFTLHPEFQVWEKTLAPDEVDRLMRI